MLVSTSFVSVVTSTSNGSLRVRQQAQRGIYGGSLPRPPHHDGTRKHVACDPRPRLTNIFASEVGHVTGVLNQGQWPGSGVVVRESSQQKMEIQVPKKRRLTRKTSVAKSQEMLQPADSPRQGDDFYRGSSS
jgi:hypothetical protein